MSAPDAIDPVRMLEDALAFDERGVVGKPLDVIGLIDAAALVTTPAREELWRRLFLEAPLPYWQVARWAQVANDIDLPNVLEETNSDGWKCVEQFRKGHTPSLRDVLREVDERFECFDPDLYPWEYSGTDEQPPHYHKYLLGRELARSFVTEAAGDSHGPAKRSQLLLEHKQGWEEWLRVNECLGYSAAMVSDATTLALDDAMSRNVTAAVDGVGRTHILLEQLTVTKNPAIGVVTAAILPVDHDHRHLDGAIVPDLRDNGLLVVSDEFLAGVATAWRYVRSSKADNGPTLLRFSVQPTATSVVQQLSGRSAELAVLAAIESSARKRALRQDAAASATLTLYESDSAVSDPRTGPASFEDKKYVAALKHRMSTVVVHTDVARQWRHLNPGERAAGTPDVVPSEFYRKDALRFLETRSLWKMALTVPVAVTAAFTVLAGFWQLYKMSAAPPDLPTTEVGARLPLLAPALLGVELVCLALSLFIIQLCLRSVRSSLDSGRSAWLSLAACTLIVLAAQFSPVGVRAEGLLDNPFYSVLFGEPQLTAWQVIDGGGMGFLVLHTLSQTLGFVTILFGTSAFTIRLLQTRAHGEPHFDDRCRLIEKDWRFSMLIMGAFLMLVTTFSLPRNVLWYYYLTTLSGVELIDNGGSFIAVIGPLLGIYLVLVFSVFVVWFFVLRSYLSRVVAAAQGRSGYTAADVVTRLPPMARWVYATCPGE